MDNLPSPARVPRPHVLGILGIVATFSVRTERADFEAALDGRRRAELLPAELGVQVDDYLILCEWDAGRGGDELDLFLLIPEEARDEPADPRYTGRQIFLRVSHVAPPGWRGLPEQLTLAETEKRGHTSRRGSSTRKMAAVVEEHAELPCASCGHRRREHGVGDGACTICPCQQFIGS
jgi:hypothetical protein